MQAQLHRTIASHLRTVNETALMKKTFKNHQRELFHHSSIYIYILQIFSQLLKEIIRKVTNIQYFRFARNYHYPIFIVIFYSRWRIFSYSKKMASHVPISQQWAIWRKRPIITKA